MEKFDESFNFFNKLNETADQVKVLIDKMYIDIVRNISNENSSEANTANLSLAGITLFSLNDSFRKIMDYVTSVVKKQKNH